MLNLFAVTLNVNPNSYVSFLGHRKLWKNYSALYQRTFFESYFISKISDHNLICHDYTFEECESGNVHVHLLIEGDIGFLWELKVFFAEAVNKNMELHYQDRLVDIKPVTDRLGWIRYIHKDSAYIPNYNMFKKK